MPSIRIAHISDLHFGRHLPNVVADLQEELHRMQPTLVALSGDLTQRAKPRELAAAADFIRALPEPRLVVPGNHDLPGWHPLKRFVDPWRSWSKHVGLELESYLTEPGFVAIGVKTARRWGFSMDWSRGRINRDQLARVRRLAETTSPGRLRIMVAHHPFLLGHTERHRGLVGRAGTALQALGAAGIDIILGGHLHLSYAGVAGGVVISQAGTATSSRYKGEPNGFNRIEATPEHMRVDSMIWQDSGFTPNRHWTFHRSSTGDWRPGSEPRHRPSTPTASTEDAQPHATHGH